MKNIEFKNLIYPVYIILFIFSFIDFGGITYLSSFKRIIGIGVIHGHNVAMLPIEYFMIIILLMLIGYIVYKYILNLRKKYNSNIQECKEIWAMIDDITIMALVHNLIYILPSIGFVKISSTYFLLAVMLLRIAYLALGIYKIIPCNTFKIYAMLWYSTTIPLLSIAINVKNASYIVAGAELLLPLVILVLLKCNSNYIKKIELNPIVILISCFSLYTSLYIESVNILTQYDIYVVSPLLTYVIVGIGIFVIGILGISKINRIYNNLKQINYEKISYFLSTLGLLLLSAQLPLQFHAGYDIFESANYGVLISGFLQNNEIPILSHYGGHMLQGVLEGVVYGIINNDNIGAIYSPYSYYFNVSMLIFLYYISSKIIGEDNSFYMVLFLPIAAVWSYIAPVGIVVITFMWYNKSKNINSDIKKCIVMWLSVVLLCLYRLDLGYAAVLALIAVTLFNAIVKRDKSYVLVNLSSFITLGVIFTLISMVILHLYDINIFDRFKEFIFISDSNLHWGHGSLGNRENLVYYWIYLIVPVALIMSLLFLANNIWKKHYIEYIEYLLLLFGLMYIFNMHRSLIRHSLAEGVFSAKINEFFIVYIAILSVYVIKSYRWYILILGLFPAITVISFTVTNDMGKNFIGFPVISSIQNNMAGVYHTWRDKPFEVEGNKVNIYQHYKESGESLNRFLIPEKFNEEFSTYKVITDKTLTGDETFADYANRNFVYPALNYRDPFYASQFPAMLAGEVIQEISISDWDKQKEKIPIVFMPMENKYLSTQIDAIKNHIRHYKVSEYIYKNYRPLCCVDDLAVWVLNSRYDEMIDKLSLRDKKEIIASALGKEKKIIKVDYGYDALGDKEYNEWDQHCYRIIDLPIIWAEKDVKNATDNKVEAIFTQANDLFVLNNVANINKSKGNYIKLSCVNSGDEIKDFILLAGSMTDSKFINNTYWQFNIKSGKHSYLLRISSDYMWYANQINAVKFTNINNLEDIKIEILEGD